MHGDRSDNRAASRPGVSKVVAVVPAAGRAVRFGGGKLVADVRGEPLLNHTLRCLLEGGVGRLIVVRAEDSEITPVTLLGDARVTTVVNPDPSRGMFSSIQTGLAAAAGDPLLVLPADMPFVTSATVAVVVDECTRIDRLVVPTYKARRGHPLAIPGRLRGVLLAADPTKTLRDALLTAAGYETTVEVPVKDPGVLRDVDFRADLIHQSGD